MNTEIELHQLCSMLPEMSEAELQEMAADMRKHGMLEPIVTLGGLVLDGRHRAMVCAMLGREPEFITWEDLVARGKSRTPAERARRVPNVVASLSDRWLVDLNVLRRADETV